MGTFAHVMKTMMNWQPSGSQAWSRQQQAKIEQQQEDRAAQQADLEFHQHMIDIGALPVVNGLVKEQVPLTAPGSTMPEIQQGSPAAPSDSSDSQATPSAGANGGLPLSGSSIRDAMLSPTQSGPYSSANMLDEQGNPNPAWQGSGGDANPTAGVSQRLVQQMMPGPQTGNLTIVRKADTSRTQKWKDAAGGTVAYEIPSPDSQAYRQSMERHAQAVQQQMAAQERGRLDAQNEQRERYGTPLSGDLAQQYGVDPDQKFLPLEKVQLATRYFPVVGAGVRGNATVSAAQVRADATNYKTDLDNTTKQAIADQDSMDRQNALEHRDKWNAAIVGAKNNGQGNLNARAFLANSARDMALHTALLGNISKENQRQMLAQSALAVGPDGQPVTKDGDTFSDPWSGKQLTMNSAQRLRLRSALSQSQSTVAGYQQSAADLESRRDAILNRFGAPGGADASGNNKQLLWRGPGPAPPGSQPAPVPSGAPAGGAPGASSPNPGSSAPAAGPGSSNLLPRGRGVQKVADYVNAAAADASRPPAPVSPAGRAPNWADDARAESGSSAMLPGRAAPSSPAPSPPAAAPTGARPQAKIATQAEGRIYAQKKGISPAAALKEFQTSGYTVQ